ncbi:MAG: hypothetical protein JSU68_14595 [Phycisphaerales bacterium]|nr:MAG: hypothetical protein JSU68_14595 [Phycisphaerales bacterium]
MKVKNVVSVVLLLFVAASVVYLVAGESLSRSEPNQATQSATVAEPMPAETAAGRAARPTEAPAESTDEPVQVVEKPTEPQHKLVAYYFHRTQRCRTCLTMEAYAQEALEESFPAAIESGELQWQAVNVEEPANEHFVIDFGLTSSALVLVNMHDGERGEWRNLEQVWELVGDELKFKAYVAAEAMLFLEDAS